MAGVLFLSHTWHKILIRKRVIQTQVASHSSPSPNLWIILVVITPPWWCEQLTCNLKRQPRPVSFLLRRLAQMKHPTVLKENRTGGSIIFRINLSIAPIHFTSLYQDSWLLTTYHPTQTYRNGGYSDTPITAPPHGTAVPPQHDDHFPNDRATRWPWRCRTKLDWESGSLYLGITV